ncbi:MAG: hypothetical protein PHQ40_09450, partial [Anaerolineaceae bacterium]|nr:hypothetical protein [Anaerolineaceae bacterium]
GTARQAERGYRPLAGILAAPAPSEVVTVDAEDFWLSWRNSFRQGENLFIESRRFWESSPVALWLLQSRQAINGGSTAGRAAPG